MDAFPRVAASPLGPGASVARFRIVKLLGRGGMGEVYLAEDPTLQRSVALKLLAPGTIDDAERQSWFRREATSAAALNHPNICTVFEVGDDAGRLFIAMEAIEGRTLRAVVADGPLPIDRVIDIGLQIASALDHAQERHVVHRDLKCANIMITSRGAVKVLDFGVAKRVRSPAPAADHPTEWVSRSDVQVGTLPYMSPEQALARPVDHRSDLFSLGVVLYECLTGTPPFAGASAPELLDAILHRDPPPVDKVRPGVPAALASIVARLLQKAPELRYQSAHDVAADLRALRETGTVGIVSPPASRRRRLVASTLAIGAVVVAMAAWFGARRFAGPPPLPTTLVVVPAAVVGPAEVQYLTEAIPTSLTARLTESGRLRMKMPPTSAEFARIGGNLARVGETYGVAACLVPRATVTGSRLVIDLEIVNAATRDVVWSGQVQNGLERYGEAVAKAADAVESMLVHGERSARVRTAPPESSAVELAVGRGRYYSLRFNAQPRQADFDAADAAFGEALHADPRSSSAAAERAVLYVYGLQAGRPGDQMLPQIESWARRALDSDQRNGLAWLALAAAELWRPDVDLQKLLDYGFRSAALGEDCGRCQFGLIPAVSRFSQLLKHHTSQRQAALDPFSATAVLNSAVALGALGRSAEAETFLAQAQSIDRGALWVRVHEAFVRGFAGDAAGAASAAALVQRDNLATVPTWIPPMLELLGDDASHDGERLARHVRQLRDAIQQRRVAGVGVQYAVSVTVPILARQGHLDAALDILTAATDADSPPPYDMLVMNSYVRPLLDDARARDMVLRSRARFEVLLRAIDEARSAGRFPPYLEQPLASVRAVVRTPAPAGARSDHGP